MRKLLACATWIFIFNVQQSLQGCLAARVGSSAASQLLVQSDQKLTFKKFLTLTSQLNSDLRYEGALQRVFNSLAAAGRNLSNRALSADDFIQGIVVGDHQEYVHGLWEGLHGRLICPDKCAKLARGNVYGLSGRDWAMFLESIGQCWSTCWQVPRSYNFDESTTENYAIEFDAFEQNTDFYGQYVSIRALRNHTYHTYYESDRQLWQDVWINRLVNRARGHEKPWIIYTAGGMGVGKGWVLKWLANNGIFGVESVVNVNPDYFKSVMPEYKLYQFKGKEEGTMCHTESAYMQEIAQEAALQQGSHILVDGSLRDKDWFVGGEKYFGVIKLQKEMYPHYRVAILHVDLHYQNAQAKETEILRRLKERELSGERATPIAKALHSYEGSAATVDALVRRNMVDLAVTIDNTEKTPKLIRVAYEAGWQADVPESDEARWELVKERIGPNALLANRGSSEAVNDRRTRAISPMVKADWDTLIPTLG